MEDHSHSQAISFANSYFSLVDGLVPGLEDHLSENVVLDWFGKTIRGRKNVTEFMKAHKLLIGSRHVFNNILPVPDINYDYNKKSQITNRKIFNPKTDNHVSTTLLARDLNFDKLSIDDSEIDTENNNVPENPEFDRKKNLKTDEISTICELGENDLSNLFEIIPLQTREEEIAEKISQIKSDEKLMNRRYFIENFNEKVESIKYLEANGHIEFSKKSMKRGTDLQIWKRQSKLQIAYSFITTNERVSEYEKKIKNQEKFDPEIIMETDDYTSASSSSPGTKLSAVYKNPRLPSLGEITEISNNLIPNINNFGGYFPPSFDFINERDEFLENFNAELTLKNSTASLRTPQYIDNRLIFNEINNKANENEITIGDKIQDKELLRECNNRFVFNYFIHLIIYKGNSKCRRSLSQEFDLPDKNKKRFFSRLEY